MNDHDPENSRAVHRKSKTSQATIAMPNGSHQQLGQHPRCNFLPHAIALVCTKPSVDIGACLIDAGLDQPSSTTQSTLAKVYRNKGLYPPL
jgi:hypothetical protein